MVTAKDFIRILKSMGFTEARQKGSHKFFVHLDGRRLTVPVHPGRDLDPALVRLMLRQVGTSAEEFFSQ